MRKVLVLAICGMLLGAANSRAATPLTTDAAKAEIRDAREAGETMAIRKCHRIAASHIRCYVSTTSVVPQTEPGAPATVTFRIPYNADVGRKGVSWSLPAWTLSGS